jgi:hypothetical protein
MRLFWLILSLLGLAALVLVWRGGPRNGSGGQDAMAVATRGDGDGSPATMNAPDAGPAWAASSSTGSSAGSLPDSAAAPESIAAPAAPAEPVLPGTIDPETAKLIEELAQSAEARRAAEEAFGTAAPRLGEISAAASGAPPAPEGPVPGAASPDPAGTPGGAAAPAALPPAPLPSGAAALEHTVPSKIERREDGAIVLDDAFVIRGSGTPEDPYQVTWDLLVSCSETYQPRLGKLKIPQRVAMLNGSHVRITGYLGFPFAALEVKELLVMLNRWDGCCLGVPPSPYDGIEVRLARPFATRGGGHMIFNYGTVEGKLMVDPYLINEWLVGLYLMEDAKLTMDM